MKKQLALSLVLTLVLITFVSTSLHAEKRSEADQVMSLLSAFQTDCSLVDGSASQAITAVDNCTPLECFELIPKLNPNCENNQL